MKKIIIYLLIFASIASKAVGQDTINVFPIEHYDQNIDNWISPTSPNYDKPLVGADYQEQRLADFYRHYYSDADDDLSPWSKDYVNKELVQPNGAGIVNYESEIITSFYLHNDKQNKTPYALNYRPYTYPQFQRIANNMDFDDQMTFAYTAENRAIAIDNLDLRALPTAEPLFYNHNIVGEGYPFDNLQETAIFIGMPLYIIKESKDKIWSLVISSDAIGWVKTAGIIRVNESFIKKWLNAANNGLVAMTKEQAITDAKKTNYGVAYNGNTLPLLAETGDDYKVLIPIRGNRGYASTKEVILSKNYSVKMPMQLTPHNMIGIIKNQLGKPYGWGSQLFNYDCSAETKALFTPFGFYLPRNSQNQAEAGNKVAILDKLSSQERENYLIKNGHKFMTLVQIPGHILLYLGNYPNPDSKDHEIVPLSYQNIWGMRTPANDSRSVIGGAVILPLQSSYSEDKNLLSFFNNKHRTKFRLIYLDNESDNKLN